LSAHVIFSLGESSNALGLKDRLKPVRQKWVTVRAHVSLDRHRELSLGPSDLTPQNNNHPRLKKPGLTSQGPFGPHDAETSP